MPYSPQSSEAEHPHQFSARWFLVIQRVSSSLLVVLVQQRYHGGGLILLRGRANQVSEEPQMEGLHPIGNWQAPADTPDSLVRSVPVVWNS